MEIHDLIIETDVVLSYFQNHPDFIGYEELHTLLGRTNPNIQNAVLDRILEKLERDKYIFTAPNGRRAITVDGAIFTGYEATLLTDAAAAEQQQLEIDRLKSVDVSSDQNQKRLNDLTDHLVKATWWAFRAAVLLLSWQVVQFLLEHFVLKKSL